MLLKLLSRETRENIRGNCRQSNFNLSYFSPSFFLSFFLSSFFFCKEAKAVYKRSHCFLTFSKINVPVVRYFD